MALYVVIRREEILDTKPSLHADGKKNCGFEMAAAKIASAPPFHYRHNKNGTIDAICLECFMTAATAATLEDLEVKLADHGCYLREIGWYTAAAIQ
jgi:hypothetical protein